MDKKNTALWRFIFYTVSYNSYNSYKLINASLGIMDSKIWTAVVNMKPSRNILVVDLLQNSLYDESGVMCYEYGDMGEVTQETRIYALPFLTNPLALSTQFTYDSWGRIQSVTYPDNEVVSYAYDLGGQLQSISNNSNYTYLDNVAYDRFGAKVSQTYGNGLVTDYTYENLTRRLSQISVTDNSSNPYSDIQYGYDPVGNVTQANSTCPWLQNHTFSETFTYDASDQLVAAVEQGGGYSLAVTYGNWGKVNTYDLTQTDRLQNTSTQNAYTFTYPTNPNNPQQAQTMFAPAAQLGGTGGMQAVTAQYTFGINGSLRKKEHLTHNNPVEYYLFNSAANMKAYSYDKTDFAYYGYNASNTRTYKLNFLNANSWVNGQQLPIHPQSIQAMFYPNAYLNFNQNGEYTKHYYNGSERIASRLGNTALSISMEMTDRLQERVGKLETRFQDDIRELVYTNVQVEIPPVSATSLQQTGTPTDIFYYHTNHLGSTAYVTDQSQNVTQGFLYAPFGEITTEYAPLWQNATLPKYAFNAKELDEETGMYYYEARYYKPPVFTSRDPMFEKYFWMTPYAYCANNPVKYVDPTGMKVRFAGNEEEKTYNDYKEEISRMKNNAYKIIEKQIERQNKGKRIQKNKWFNANYDYNLYKGIEDELSDIEQSDETFAIFMGKNAKDIPSDANGSFNYNFKSNEFEIKVRNVGSIGDLAHELKHADQYMKKQLGFSWLNGPIAYDQTDEIAAYARSGLFGGKDIGEQGVLEKYGYLLPQAQSVPNYTKMEIYNNLQTFKYCGMPEFVFNGWKGGK